MTSTGIANLGNTCFLNAAVQLLNHTPELQLFRPKMSVHVKSGTCDERIWKEWTDLYDTMKTGEGGVVSPNKFVFSVHQVAKEKGRELFTGYAQNDMPEFLLFMVECMHNCVSRPQKVVISGKTVNEKDRLAVHCYQMIQSVYSKEYSEIMELFYGIYVSEIVHPETDKPFSVKAEHFFILDLPILPKSRCSLLDCFLQFTAGEQLSGENAWFNETTGKKEETVIKRIRFWKFPKVLVITLKRFSPDGRRKNQAWVDFPLDDLDLSQFVIGYNPDSYVYELYGVCNHSGGVMGGHYTAYAKSKTGEWRYFNDTNVHPVPDANVVVSPAAYCLFYRKKNKGV